ncbi:MAG: A/G-specific adenine glycosylase [Chloroflexi bacterium]|nr:A/G-specific adenine glycosylase [Chloroflexota bacterium]
MPILPSNPALDNEKPAGSGGGAPFAADLLAWYDHLGIELPWRGEHDPYRIWLSEIMLQQTQVETVKPYYARFLVAFPTVEALAAAPLDRVLKLWEGLGYYSRARNLHRAAEQVASLGAFPSTLEGLLDLPGIGRYTAGAIASIAFGVHAPVLDGNVIRVFARLLDLPDDVQQPATQRRLWETAEAWLPAERTGDYNQALMDLGRLICKPRAPECAACPIRAHCLAYANGTQAERPVKAARAKTPHYDVTAGLIRNERGDLLIAQRPLDGLLGGLWEFPGGKLEPGETLPECLKRELREELGIEVEVGDLFVQVRHGFTHFKITLYTFECRYIGGEPQPLGVHDFAWVREDELDRYSFGKADRQVIAALVARRGMMF